MGWAKYHIAGLQNKKTVQFRPHGHSMRSRIESGQLCTVEPVNFETLAVNDVVLCKVGGFEYLHIVKAIQDDRYQIGNSKGHINGWVGRNCIYGKLIKIED